MWFREQLAQELSDHVAKVLFVLIGGDDKGRQVETYIFTSVVLSNPIRGAYIVHCPKHYQLMVLEVMVHK